MQPPKAPPFETLDDSLAPERSQASAEREGSARASGRDLMTIERAHYEFDTEIARGGLGRISKARDSRLNRVVAIKELIAPSPTSETRFLREIEITVRLQHPNIVAIHEAGRWPDGQPFYAMNFVAGQTLVHSIHNSASLSERLNLLSVVLHVTDAVAFAHSEGIVHRDLKPANILVGPFGETVVIDWGLAKYTGVESLEPALETPVLVDVTRIGAAIGTPPYMPPEQATGRATNERSDVYALGAILYHVLSGRRPFFEVEDATLLETIGKRAPIPVRRLVPTLAPDLAAIVGKAMAIEPTDRYASAQEFGEELRRFTSGQLVESYRYGVGDRLLRLVRRNFTAFATAVVFLVALALLAGISFERVRRAKDVAERSHDAAKNERDRAESKADALIVSQAQAYSLTDPTRAVAWLKQLERIPNGALSVAAQADESGVARWVLRGHTDAINCTDTSADSQWVVSGSDDRSVRLWKLGGESYVLERHAERVASCRFAPSGTLFASGGYDGQVILWNLQDQQPHALALNDSPVKALAFSKDGATLYAATQAGLMRFYSLTTDTWVDYPAANERWPTLIATDSGLLSGPHLGSFRLWRRDGSYTVSPSAPEALRAATWNSAAKSALLGGAGGTVWAWANGSSQLTRLAQVSDEVTAIAQPMGDAPIVATEKGQVLALEASGARNIATHTQRVIDVLTSGSGRFVASGGWDKHVILYDTQSRSTRVLLGHGDVVSALSFAENEQFLVSASWDTTLRVWPLGDSAQRERRVFDGHQVGVHSVRFSPDGKSLASGGHDNAVRLWNLDRGDSLLLKEHTDHVYRVIYSPDGLHVASSGDDQVVHVWSSTGEHEQTLRGHSADVEELAFSPDSRWLASASEDHTARLWNVSNWQGRALPHEKSVTQVVFHPSSKLLATASLDGKLRLFETDSGQQQELINEHVGELADVAFSVDGALAAAAPEANQVLWRTADESHLRAFQNLAGARTVAFSKDGHLLAVSGARSLLWVCDLASEHCKTFPTIGGAIRSLRFAPDGRSLATAGSDSVVYLWDIASTERREFRGHRATIFDLDISPDGRFIATAGGDASVRLWPLVTAPPSSSLPAELQRLTAERIDTNEALDATEWADTGATEP